MNLQNVSISFSEFPNKISLVLSISGCPFKCPGCHSPELQNPSLGVELTDEYMADLLDKYASVVDSIIFFGGDQYPGRFEEILKKVRTSTKLIVVLWTGANKVPKRLTQYLHYVKLGRYIESYGGLENPSTNQRFYKLPYYEDFTYLFQQG